MPADISPFSISYVVLFTVCSPLLAFIYQAVRGRSATTGIPSILAILGSLVGAIYIFSTVWNQPAIHIQQSWFTLGDKVFYLGFLLNNISAIMLVLVPLIALPVHIYSTSYMHGDRGIHRYWMYLSLFCFAMLGLLVADNLLLMYIFWELVGFASYLLIGFWFTRESAVQANKKAFIINRIGDLGFLIGISIIFTQFGTLDLVLLFSENGLLSQVDTLSSGWFTAAGIAFFIGAMAKSAQFPLHVWLPDAMEGPTAVSSLIHAATMVAAGVFLLTRIFPLFNADVLLFISIIGILTACTAAYFALAQYDIKKILAYSTISQLGYMMVGVGIGAYDAALLHLLTHAFFKCLLFLAAGAVIHEMQHLKTKLQADFDPQDLRNMGGLRKWMPKTALLMGIASLALAGFPLTSGFLSKDALIIAAFEWAAAQSAGYQLIPYLLVLVSMLTSFYIARLMFKAFFGENRLEALKATADHKATEDYTSAADIHATMHEAPKTMLLPMLGLAVCCLFPLFSLQPLSASGSWIMQGLGIQYAFDSIHSLHLIVPLVLVLSSLLSMALAWRWYAQQRYPLQAQAAYIRAAEKQLYLNEFNNRVFVGGVMGLAKASYWFDRHIVGGAVHGFTSIVKTIARWSTWVDATFVDGFVNGVAAVTYWLGHQFRQVQNGKIQNYLFGVFLVVFIGLLYLIFS